MVQLFKKEKKKLIFKEGEGKTKIFQQNEKRGHYV